MSKFKKEMKPLEIVFYKSDGSNWLMKIFYNDGTTEEIVIDKNHQE